MKRIFTGKFAIVDRVVDSVRKTASEIVRTAAGRYSVGFLVHDPESDSVILVKQRRAAMICDVNPEGEVVEVPAGRCDRPESVKRAIAREAEEEIGAVVEEDQIEMLNSGEPLAMSPGIIDEMMYLAYIRLRPGQLSPDRVFGVEEEGEFITRILVPADEAYAMVCVDMKTKALLLELMRRRIATIAQGRVQ
jgi:8-oxo-dGTP pyrophosphatase MutT (NUDIX family)